MEVILVSDAAEIGALAGRVVQKLVTRKPDAVLGLATGSSPMVIYDEMARLHQEEGLSFARCTAFMLDEYVGLAPDHPQRYRNVIEKCLVSRVDLRSNAVHGPDGNASDISKACARYEEKIEDAGGVDLQILGIGSDGHIAFNEPGSALTSRTRDKALAPETIIDNARFFDDDPTQVPPQCLTQGLGTIMEARHLLLVATGHAKAEAIQHLVEGAVSAMWPATVIQLHPHATVIIDDAAGSRLTRRGHYRHYYALKPHWQDL
jgi:glucosamine-6-phosphate deaminase